MKGKSLYLLIDELNKSERHQLLNNSKRSGDKRQSALYKLVKNWTGSIETYELLLQECTASLFESKKDAKEEDKVQRRFIDFSIKEIELIKLKNFLAEDHLMRNFLLTKIYSSKSHPEVNDRYLKKIAELSAENNDRFWQGYYLNEMIEKTSQSHTRKETSLLHNLLIEKNELIQKNYHSDLSGIYNLISLLLLEDTDLLKELKSLILTHEELEVLIELSKGSAEEVVYLTARARFQFYEPILFFKYFNEANTVLKKLKDKRAHKELLEELNLLRVLFGLHHGENATLLLPFATVLEQGSNGTQRFYFLLIKLLDSVEKGKTWNDNKEINKLALEPENAFRKEFLLALYSFIKKDYSPALKRLNELSYTNHPQISTWSRLLELHIHIRKENYALCDSLINRLNRHFKTNKSKEFTSSSDKWLFNQLQQRLKSKPLSSKKDVQAISVCSLHKIMLA